jgi:glycogen debranching enzyme
VSEIFDGDSPHIPRGCFAQAWSVAEVLRITYEEIEMLVPDMKIADEMTSLVQKITLLGS